MKKQIRKSLVIGTLLLGATCLSACSVIDNFINYINETNSIKVYATNMELNARNLTLSKNNTFRLEAIFTPTNTSDKTCTWVSSNPSVCSVDNGLLTGLEVGEADITATSADEEFTSTCHVRVVHKDLEGLSISKTTLNLQPTHSRTLSAVYSPMDASDREVIWSSNDETVAKVDQNGVVTAQADAVEGETATITVTSEKYPSFNASCEVSIVENSETSEKTKMNYTYKEYSKNSVYQTSVCPSVGNVKLLVIPVWFSDSEEVTGIKLENRNKVKEDIRKTYFGTETETGWNSVKTFYETESTVDDVNLLTLDGTVSDWYEVDKQSQVYGRADSATTTDLVKKAADWYFANNPSDSRTNYDSDKDGLLDGVMLIYAAPDYRSSREAEFTNFWAYCYWARSAKNVASPNVDTYFWASYDFMYGTNKLTGLYYGGDDAHCNLDAHTYIHEMGHVFGLEDYYDYSDQKNPAGGFSMQDYNVGAHDPFSAISLGWANPYIPTDSQEIKIKPFQTNHDVILLTPEMNSTLSAFDEYILLEYYTPTGLNQLDTTYKYKNTILGPTDSGIRVWHVDARVAYARMLGGNVTLDAETLTSNLTLPGTYAQAFKNTYYSSDEGSNNYCTLLGSGYSDYNLLQLIRNDENAEVFKSSRTAKGNQTIGNKDLFKVGDTFQISQFAKQFINGSSGKLNNNIPLGFSFKVENMTASEATIKIVSQ